MIWQTPWALAGLLAVVLPVLIHLLSRKRAVLQKFPSLRFLNTTRLLPTRSPNLSDIPLLLVRLAIVALAALALAQPLWVSPSRKQSFNASLARVIIVDTSGSMQRISANGRTLADSARVLSEQLAAGAEASIVLQTASPARDLAGASAWLEVQGARGEVVILSDFQFGTIDSAVVELVSPQFGVRLMRIGHVQAPNVPVSFVTASGSVSALADSVGTSGEWKPLTGARAIVNNTVQVLSATSDRDAVDAARSAAGQIAPSILADSTQRVVIVFAWAAERAALIQNAKTPGARWMSSVLLRVRNSDVLVRATQSETASDTSIGPPFAVVATTAQGSPIVFAAEGDVNGTHGLLFFHRGRPGNLSSAALFAAIDGAMAGATNVAEAEPLSVSDRELRQLEREPREVSEPVGASAVTRSGMSDARWFWVAVLALMVLETFMRRAAQKGALLEVA